MMSSNNKKITIEKKKKWVNTQSVNNLPAIDVPGAPAGGPNEPYNWSESKADDGGRTPVVEQSTLLQ